MIRNQIVAIALIVLAMGGAMAQSSTTTRVQHTFEPQQKAEFTFNGPMGTRIEANVDNWLLTAPDANPAMLAMFRDRDRTPRRDLVPWAGEFAGKYLISGVQAMRMTKNEKLRTHLQGFVSDLIATQDADGYMGPFPKDARMVGPGLWDLWGQYHVMYGLYLWYKETGDAPAFAAARKCADHFCGYFLDGNRRVYDAGSHEMNESSIHIFTLLYEETGEPRYLKMARAIESDWETPPSGDYVRQAIEGKAFYQMPKPRWESLHGIQAIAELYAITGDAKYKTAYERIWWSIVEGDRHNTGGFSSGEQATGNPYDPGAIETCCTIAWMATTIDYLRMTGDIHAADELELATWNAVLGAQNADGRWWTYNTPMDGDRKASAHDIVFQARPGSPELNCCSVNAPRGLGMLSQWAVMAAEDAVVLNYYGPATFSATTPSGKQVHIEQETGYPVTGKIRITISPKTMERFTLRLRIPSWSRDTKVIVGEESLAVTPGSYLAIDREWRPGDTIDLTLDMTPWFWVGERECQGKVSIYHGPILLAYDPRFDALDPKDLPSLRVPGMAIEPESPRPNTGPKPLLRMRVTVEDGSKVTLCDFASAGAAGNQYRSWLLAAGMRPVLFGKENPLRMAR